MKNLETISTRPLAKAALLTLVLAIGGLLAVSPTGASASRAELTTSLEVAESLVSRLARGPVPAAEAFRQINVTLADGGSGRHALKAGPGSTIECCEGQMLVLFAAVVREGRFAEVAESRPFSHRPGQSVYDAPLPAGVVANGYPPGDVFFLGDQFLSGGEFFTFQQMWSRIGVSSSSFERAAGVSLRGRDALVLVVVPADPSERESAAVQPLFIVSESGAP